MAMKPERKINLADTFGKASALTATGAGLFVYYELGRVLVAATDVSRTGFNPADHVAPGLIALGLSLAAGFAGMYLGNLKRNLVNEFNYQVKRELENMGFELVEDTNDKSKGAKAEPQYRRIPEGAYHRPIERPHHSSFWEGFYLSSILNSNSRSHGGGYSSSGSSRRSSSSSSSSKGGGQGAAILLAAAVLAVAAAASAYVSYKSLKLNFGKTPDLLTTPEPDVLSAG